MAFHVIIIVTILFLVTLLALPPALIQKSWKRFVIGFILSPFAVLLPLAFFFLSTFLTPEAKNDCHNGALDCFHVGKLALTPFVFWATAALYAVEITEARKPLRPWITHGLILGALISTVCLAFGAVTHLHNDDSLIVCLIVPLYTCIWYVARAVHAIQTQSIDPSKTVTAVASSLPFWAASIWWSYKTYLALPDHHQGCFVVTAASHGHKNFVGPFLKVTHRGCHRPANQQLATLWAFEALWRHHAPRTHAAFRRVYNVVGPVIARRINSPWLADAFYIALKPAEIFARFAVNAAAFPTHHVRTSSPRFLPFVRASIVNRKS